MKLIILTQKVDKNDPILGFFHRWLELFAKETEHLFIIAQSAGVYELPINVKVFSLGKELGYGKPRQLVNFWRLLSKNLSKVDAVLVHMVPLWIILGAPFFAVFRKPVYLWYVHPKRNFIYSVAGRLVKKVFTPVHPLGFSDPKIVETGHGIDVKCFKPVEIKRHARDGEKRVIAVGRISPIKHQREMLETIVILKNKYRLSVKFDIIGDVFMPTDRGYKKNLEKFIDENGLRTVVRIIGWVPPEQMPTIYQSADLVLNFTPTGSFDKAVLEAMSVDIPVLVANRFLEGVIPDKFVIDDLKNIQGIAVKIKDLFAADHLAGELRSIIERRHNLYHLIPRLIREMQSVTIF